MVVTIPIESNSFSTDTVARNRACVDSEGVVYIAVFNETSQKIVVYTIKKPFTTYTKLFEVTSVSFADEVAITAHNGNVYGVYRNSDVLTGFYFANGVVGSFYAYSGDQPRFSSIAVSGGYVYTASQDKKSGSLWRNLIGSKVKINIDGLGTAEKIVYGPSLVSAGISYLVPIKGGVAIGSANSYKEGIIISNAVGDLSTANANGFATTVIPDAKYEVIPALMMEGTNERLVMLYKTVESYSGRFKIKKSNNDLLSSFADMHTHFGTGNTYYSYTNYNYVGISSDLLGNIYITANDRTTGITTYLKKISPNGEITTILEEVKTNPDSSYSYYISLFETAKMITPEPLYAVRADNRASSISLYGNIQLPELTPMPKDLGNINDRTVILRYTLSNYPVGTTVTEKINGVTVGTKTIISGTEYTVSATLAQWDAVKYGRYKDTLGGKNVVTLEVSTGEVYTYPFTKTLPTTAKTNDVLVAVNDMSNTAMASHKKRLVDAIGNKATVGGTGTLEDITKAIESISVENMSGMKIATGTFKTDSSATASVRGISFKPKGIVYQSPSYVAGGVYFIKDFHGDVVFSRSVDFGMNNSGSSGTNIFTPLDNGFDIKTASTVETYSYVVFG